MISSEPPTCTPSSSRLAETDLSKARMKISLPLLAVYPVMKARAIELAGLTIGLVKVTKTGAEPVLREPRSA